ncbi:MAG: two-component regulator propeller domain-containing protein, partial [Bacteroidota bacterium]
MIQYSNRIFKIYIILALWASPVLVFGQSIGESLRLVPSQPSGAFGMNDQIVDGDGYLWLATNGALIRHDGQEEKQFEYRRGDTTGLHHPMISRLDTLPGDRLLIQSLRAVTVLDLKTDRMRRIRTSQWAEKGKRVIFWPAPYGGNARVLGSEKGWGFWDAGSGEYEIVRYENMEEEEGTQPFAVQLPDQTYLLASKTRTLRWEGGAEGPKEVDIDFSEMFENGDGPTLSLKLPGDEGWVFSTRLGRIHLYTLDWKRRPLSDRLREIDFGAVNKLLLGPDGALWIGTLAGLYHLPLPATGLPTHLRDDFTVNSMRVDRDDNIWFGTSRGYHVLSALTFRFHYVPLKPKGGESGLTPWGLHVDADSNLWAGTYAGVLRIDLRNFPEFGAPEYFTKGGSPTNLTHVLPLKDRKLVVAPAGMYHFFPESGRYVPFLLRDTIINRPFDARFIYALPLEDSLFICAANARTFAFNPYTGAVNLDFFPHGDSVGTVLHQDEAGTIWSSRTKIGMYPQAPKLQAQLDRLWGEAGGDEIGVTFALYHNPGKHL